MGADLDLIQGAVVLLAAVVLALGHSALNGTIYAAMTIHEIILLHSVSTVVCAVFWGIFRKKLTDERKLHIIPTAAPRGLSSAGLHFILCFGGRQ